MVDIDIDLDFDFATGEIIEEPRYDRVDFSARVVGYWGTASVTHWVKIPKGNKKTFVMIRHALSDVTFEARLLPRTSKEWKGEPPTYLHESIQP